MDQKKYAYQCSNNPEHLFEESTEGNWCPLCDISTAPMLLPYTAPEPIISIKEEKVVQPVEANEEPEKPAKKEKKNNPQIIVAKREEHDQEPLLIEKTPKIKHEIPEITFGNQTWMMQFLNITSFRTKEELFFAKNQKDWLEAKEKRIPAWCYPSYDTSLGTEFGILYNFFAAVHPAGLAPEGWFVPGLDDVLELKSNIVHGFLDNHFKITDNYPLQHRLALGTFVECGAKRIMWTSSKKVIYTAHAFSAQKGSSVIELSQFDKSAGFFIRCIKSK